jgi:peptide/nickel transport system substrate-binding protein
MNSNTWRARLLATLAAVVLAAAACSDDGDGAAEESTGQGFGECAELPNTCNSGERTDGGSITWIVESLPAAWASISSSGGSVYTLQMLHGILPHTGQFEPDGETYKFNMDLLAEEPELLNEDPFSYQFKIRDEAVWDDGTPITAEDFVVTWHMSASESEGYCVGCDSRSAAGADRIESIIGSDDGKTVTITLKPGQADPEWFAWGGTDDIAGGIMPAHIAAQNNFDVSNPEQLGQYFEYLHTTMPTWSGGPYRLVEGDLENSVIKEPNDAWYGEIDPTLDTYIVRFLTDQGAWTAALANGEVHGANPTQLNEDIVTQLDGMDNVLVNIGPGPSWEHIDFNLDVPAFADVNLRLAVFTAIDTAEIAERVIGPLYPDYTLRTNHGFPERSPYHVDLLTESGQGSGDADSARAILESAGYEWDADGTLMMDGEQIGPFRLRSTGTPVRVTSMELIQSYLAEIGIEVAIEPTDDLGTMLVEQDYDIAQFGWSGSPLFVGQPAQHWMTNSGSNFGNYSNSVLDELALAQFEATSPDEAAAIANEAVELLVPDAYVLPMFDVPVYMFVTDDYINVRDNGAASLRAFYENHTWGTVAQ